MSYNVKCDACGHMNPLGRLFCAKCGGRLAVSPESVHDSEGGIVRVRRWAVRSVRLAIFLIVLLGLVQLIRPVQPEGHPGALQEANDLAQKLNLLSVAVLDHRVVTETASEAELNGYLDQILKSTPDLTAAGPLKFQLRSINVALRNGEVVTVMVSSLGSLNLSYEIRAKPARVDEQFTLDVQGLRMGHLPLPGRFASWTATRLARVFGQLEREKRLLDQVTLLEVEDGVVRVTTPGT